MASSMDTFSEAEISFEAKNWAAARDNFQKGHKDKKAMAEFLAHQSTAQQARTSCLEAQTRANSQYNPRLGGVLSKIETFMKVGDLAMKSAPESVGLAWTGIRLCLRSFEDDFATFNLFSGAAADIVGILISCRVYGKMYGGHKGPEDFQELHKKVVEYIPGIYTDILHFSYAMNKYMGRNTGSRIVRGLLTSASGRFQPMIDQIRANEQTMSGYASKATDQLTIHYQEVSLQQQGTMMADLSVIRDTLEKSKEINKFYLNHIHQLEEEKKSMKKKTPFDKAKELYEDNVKRLEPTSLAEAALEKHQSRREKDTCKWIFDLEEYQKWCSSTDSSLLWVSGVGGLGKSILMSTVIAGLQEAYREDKSCSAQYFFCSAGEDSTRSVSRIKRQLLYQLYQLALSDESSDILDESNDVVLSFLGKKDSTDAKASSQQKKSERPIGFEEAYPRLAKILDKKVFLIIDALDECMDRESAGILKTLQNTLSASELPLKIMVCSRPEPDIVYDLVGKIVIKVEDHNGPDIEKAAGAKLEKLPGLSPAERVLACKSIVGKAKGLFRCVDPAIEFLKKPWRRPLEKRLEELPDGLDNSYQQILRQTGSDYLELLKVGLSWSMFARIKPTIAEIMDDYSCAYADGVEGIDENPYDTMDNQLIGDQIRRAGSGTFLEVTGNEVSVRHTTVKEFFLKENPAADIPSDYCMDELCAKCQSKRSADQPLTMSEKEGQLRMVITIFKHLNSPLFQRRYLRKGHDDTKTTEPENAVANQTNDATNEGSKSGEQNTTFASTNGSSSKEVGVANLVNGNLPGKTMNAITTGSAVPEKIPTPGEEKALLDAGDGDGNTGAQSALLNGDESKQLREDPASSDQEVKAEQDGEANGPGISEEPAPEQFPNDDDDDDEGSGRLSEILDEPVADSAQAPLRPKRYELLYWPYHLASAERLWKIEEREKNDDWKELWKLVIQFLCESPDAFKIWQQHYMDLGEKYITYNVILSPLQVAAGYGIPGLVKLLLERGESAAAELEDGRSALWFGADSPNIEIITLLLESGANPNASKKFETPFHVVLNWNPKLEFVNIMLRYGADCNVTEPDGFTAMHWFALSGSDVEVFKVLMEAHGDINVADANGETPLHVLMYNSQGLILELLSAFLENGADVNQDDKESQRPLYEVCAVGNTEAAKVLLEHGANIHDDDIVGQTGVHIAAAYGHLDIVKLLTERDANLDLEDKQGHTPFFLACSSGNLETARFLLQTMRMRGNTNINKAGKDGRTPFSKAAGRGHVEVLKLLLEESDAASTVNVQETVQKRTALHWSAYNGRTEVVDVLLKKGADAKVEDVKGKTALALCGQGWARDKSGDRVAIIITLIGLDRETAAKDTELMAIAAIKGSTKVIEKLLEAKAHPSKQDEHGWTPLQLAKQYGHTDAATLLAKHGAEVGSRPSRWNAENEKLKLSEDGCKLEYVGERDGTGIQILANHPIPAGIERFYYEIEIQKNVGDDIVFNAIGFSTQPARLDRLPGWYNAIAPSFAYHGDDGKLFANSNQSEKVYAGPYGKGDTIGCGVIYNDSIEGTIFYTRNGEPQGPAFEKNVKGRLYPVVGMREPTAITVNFGNNVESTPFKWELGNSGKYDIDAVKKKKEEEPVTTQVPIEFGISKPPV